MIAQKKKVMMMQQAAPAPSGTPIVLSGWNIGKSANSSGAVINAAYSSLCNRVATGAHTSVRYTGAAEYDASSLVVYLNEYNYSQYVAIGFQGWLKRTRLYSGDNPVTLDSQTNYIAFVFAFTSTSGKTMTQGIIDDCFAAEWMD